MKNRNNKEERRPPVVVSLVPFLILAATVLASSSVGVPLFKHIRYMFVTTVPAFVIALIIYLVVSLMHPSDGCRIQSRDGRPVPFRYPDDTPVQGYV